MKTFEEACATAQQWEAEKAAGPSALVGRALLAHINDLASPQVTDEQIVAAADKVGKTYQPIVYLPNSSSIAFARAILALSAPPAAETPQECLVRNLSIPDMPCDTPLNYARFLAAVLWRDYYRDVSVDFMLLPDAVGVLSQIDNMLTGIKRKAAPQEAKPNVSAVNTSAERVQDSSANEQEAKSAAAVKLQDEFRAACMRFGIDANQETFSLWNNGRDYQRSQFAAAPQEQAPVKYHTDDKRLRIVTLLTSATSLREKMRYALAADILKAVEQAPAVDRDAVIEEVAKHVWQYKAAGVIPSWLMLEISGICKYIRDMQSQPQQVAEKGGA